MESRYRDAWTRGGGPPRLPSGGRRCRGGGSAPSPGPRRLDLPAARPSGSPLASPAPRNPLPPPPLLLCPLCRATTITQQRSHFFQRLLSPAHPISDPPRPASPSSVPVAPRSRWLYLFSGRTCWRPWHCADHHRGPHSRLRPDLSLQSRPADPAAASRHARSEVLPAPQPSPVHQLVPGLAALPSQDTRDTARTSCSLRPGNSGPVGRGPCPWQGSQQGSRPGCGVHVCRTRRDCHTHWAGPARLRFRGPSTRPASDDPLRAPLLRPLGSFGSEGSRVSCTSRLTSSASFLPFPPQLPGGGPALVPDPAVERLTSARAPSSGCSCGRRRLLPACSCCLGACLTRHCPSLPRASSPRSFTVSVFQAVLKRPPSQE